MKQAKWIWINNQQNKDEYGDFSAVFQQEQVARFAVFHAIVITRCLSTACSFQAINTGILSIIKSMTK